MPTQSPPWRYPKNWLSRRVKGKGMIHLHGRIRYVGEAFEGERVGLKRTQTLRWQIHFGPHLIGELDHAGSSGIHAVRYRRKRNGKTR
jgi:hypothetical protein